MADGTIDKYFKCWWPKTKSRDAVSSTFDMLVKNCSETDYETWEQHRDRHLGTFQDIANCQAELDEYLGEMSTTTDNEGAQEEHVHDKRTEQQMIAQEAKQQERKKLTALIHKNGLVSTVHIWHLHHFSFLAFSNNASLISKNKMDAKISPYTVFSNPWNLHSLTNSLTIFIYQTC